jgi:hypothetical protein
MLAQILNPVLTDRILPLLGKKGRLFNLTL